MTLNTPCSAYNELSYNESPAITSKLLCIKIIDSKNFGNKYPFTMSSFFCTFYSFYVEPKEIFFFGYCCLMFVLEIFMTFNSITS